MPPSATTDPARPPRAAAWPRGRLAIAAILLAVQFLIIGLVFKHAIDFDCIANWGNGPCGRASRTLAGLYCVIAALALFALLRPWLFRDLLTAGPGGRPTALIANLAGFGIAMIPALLLQEGQGRQMILPAFAFWGVGMALLLGGLLGWLAPWARWRAFLAQAGIALPVVIAAGAFAPPFAMMLQPVWRLETIADATFRAVSWLVGALGYPVTADPVTKVIGMGSFHISVAPVCSGIEGIALVSIFVTLYLWLFRAELRFPRALILYPLGILASALLNVVRIAALLILGIEGHPDLAVGGFHSHAGWMMFTLVALGVIVVARKVPALHRAPLGVGLAVQRPAAGDLPPLRQDPTAARILPFAVFMLTAVIAPAISQTPGMLYPIRVAILAAAVAMFWPIYRALPWRISPLAWIAGAAIGLMWVAIPVAPSDASPPHGGLLGAALIGWFLLRGIGTVLLVPLVEELFFRDYLESRLRGAAPDQPAPLIRTLMAAAVTAGLFALLHDRWAEALIAGLVFSYVVRRSGRISDGIAAHALANLIVFAVAVATGNLAII